MDRDEYIRWRNAQPRSPAVRGVQEERERSSEHLAQAAVPMKQLTQDSKWDYFLSLVQAKIVETKVSVQLEDADLLVNTDWSHADLAQHKARMLAWASRIEALEEVMQIPSQIVGAAEAVPDDAA